MVNTSPATIVPEPVASRAVVISVAETGIVPTCVEVVCEALVPPFVCEGISVFSWKSKPAVRPRKPSRYCFEIAGWALNRPLSASTRSTLSCVDRQTVRSPGGARLSTRILRASSSFLNVAAEPMLFTWL